MPTILLNLQVPEKRSQKPPLLWDHHYQMTFMTSGGDVITPLTLTRWVPVKDFDSGCTTRPLAAEHHFPRVPTSSSLS